MTDNVLELAGVSKQFGDFSAVNEVSFNLPRGSIYGLLGQNGAGKTTTIRMIMDILKPTTGTISILGHSSAAKVRDSIGYLPEEKGLYKKMRAWETIAYFAALKGVNKKAAKTKAFELLERFGLSQFSDNKIDALSKGMAQKVQVLSAIAHDPELIIFDEPFSGLDPVNQVALEDLIAELATQGKTVIFSTHVMQHAERLCEHFIMLAKGQKIFDGDIKAIEQLLPSHIIIETLDDIKKLQQLDSVANIVSAQDQTQQSWHIYLNQGAEPQQILSACFDFGINLTKFEQSKTNLHDAFIHLVNQHNAGHC